MNHPLRLIAIGFVLVVVGFLIPILIVSQVIPSTYFLNFFAYIASFVGLMLGIVGAATYARLNKK